MLVGLAEDISGVATVASVLTLFRPMMLVGLAEDFSGVATVASVLLLFLPIVLVGVPGSESDAVKLDWVMLNPLVVKYLETSPWFDPTCSFHAVLPLIYTGDFGS